MFIGHLPVGYILTTTIRKKPERLFMTAGLIGSVFPDLDIIYFYLIDHKQHLHHSYLTHIPMFWITLWLISSILNHFFFKKRSAYINIFFLNILLHLFLDTVVGKILWLYPFSKKAWYMFDVPAQYHFWVWNFVFHWTFLFEVAVIVWAISRYKKRAAF